MSEGSRIPGFYRLSIAERRALIAERTGLLPEALDAALVSGGLDAEKADKVVENVLGTYALPFGVALNVREPVERLETDQLATYFDRGDVLIMPRDVYDRERERLPSDVQVLGEEQRFLRKNNSVVMLGRGTDVARGDSGDVQAH